MHFQNSFTIPASPADAWKLLTDVPAIAPCLPGAELTPGASDTEFDGSMKVRIGPIKVSYKGTALIVERDDEKYSMVVQARATETTGKGSAAANLTINLQPAGAAETTVAISTELQVTGRVAGFGRSALADISERMVAQFAGNLRAMVGPPAVGQAGPTTLPTAESTTPGSDTSLDVVQLLIPTLTRYAPVGVVSIGALLLLIYVATLGGKRR